MNTNFLLILATVLSFLVSLLIARYVVAILWGV